ncbi:hypothetical protein Tco_1449204 [Tanacetum coccineum]
MFVLSQVVQIVLWYMDSGCSRHMTGDHARLINFVEKFIGTVRFGNDEYAAIVGYAKFALLWAMLFAFWALAFVMPLSLCRPDMFRITGCRVLPVAGPLLSVVPGLDDPHCL